MSLCFIQLDIVKVLIESGANVNHRDHLGVTALFWATGYIQVAMNSATHLNTLVLSFALPS